MTIYVLKLAKGLIWLKDIQYWSVDENYENFFAESLVKDKILKGFISIS